MTDKFDQEIEEKDNIKIWQKFSHNAKDNELKYKKLCTSS